MPLYEYRCEQCGDVFEVMQKFADSPLTTHEKCGGEVRRIVSAPALVFKGSGWYINDYAKGGSKAASPSAENGSAETKKEAPSTGASGDTGSSSSSTPPATTTPSSDKK